MSTPSARHVVLPVWLPYVVAASLLVLVVFQARQNFRLKHQLAGQRAFLAEVQAHSHLTALRLSSLEAKDAAYAAAKVLVAWDGASQRGIVSLQNLPPVPAGKDYQLWVLDSQAAGPISAGVLRAQAMQRFTPAQPVAAVGVGFLISLEPGGGSPAPTGGILFAVAPGS